MKLSIMTHSTMTQSIMTLSIMTLHNDIQLNNKIKQETHNSGNVAMLSVIQAVLFMLSVIDAECIYAERHKQGLYAECHK